MGASVEPAQARLQLEVPAQRLLQAAKCGVGEAMRGSRRCPAPNCAWCATDGEEDVRSPPHFRICGSWCIFDRWWSAAAGW